MPHKDPEKRREYQRRHRAEHREEINAYHREYQKDRRAEYDRRYYENNAEKVRALRAEQQRRYRAENREAVNERSRERQRRERAANPDLVWTRGLKQRHDLTPEQWRGEIDGQEGRCCYCERPLPADRTTIHVDHDHSCTCGPDRSCEFCRRGIACHECNAVLGYAGDDPLRLERIAANFARLAAEARERINGAPAQAELFDISAAASRHKKEVS
jgi:Recombination endonuclease VII